MNLNVNKINKAITAAVTGTLGWGAVVVASPPEDITASEWLALAVVWATALGVYAVPNGPSDPPAINVQPVIHVPVDPPAPPDAPEVPAPLPVLTPSIATQTTTNPAIVVQPDPTVTVQGP